MYPPPQVDWMGVPPAGTGRGYPRLGLDEDYPPLPVTVRIGQVMQRSVGRFPQEDLSC